MNSEGESNEMQMARLVEDVSAEAHLLSSELMAMEEDDERTAVIVSLLLHMSPFVQAAFNWLFYAYLQKSLQLNRERHELMNMAEPL